jgi:hypothetical protein
MCTPPFPSSVAWLCISISPSSATDSPAPSFAHDTHTLRLNVVVSCDDDVSADNAGGWSIACNGAMGDSAQAERPTAMPNSVPTRIGNTLR